MPQTNTIQKLPPSSRGTLARGLSDAQVRSYMEPEQAKAVAQATRFGTAIAERSVHGRCVSLMGAGLPAGFIALRIGPTGMAVENASAAVLEVIVRAPLDLTDHRRRVLGRAVMRAIELAQSSSPISWAWERGWKLYGVGTGGAA